jgi:hypothetical protein
MFWAQSGRPRVTTVRHDHVIRRLSTLNPTASANYIASQLSSGVSPSVATIKRRLRDDFKLRAYRPAAKPALSSKNIKDRIIFCTRYQHWNVEDWAKVMFSDESQMQQFYSYTPYVRRPTGHRYCARYTVPKVKHSPSIMIWACISARGPGALYFVPPGTTINGAAYRQILEDHLPQQLQAHNCVLFQQDGAPSHTSKLVKNWLNVQGITCLEKWPGSSPDLNPIEHCWAVLKRKVALLRPTSLTDLINKVRSVWQTDISEQYCQNLIYSMPSRIQAVLKARGGHIRA